MEPLVGASIEVTGTIVGSSSSSTMPTVVTVSNIAPLNSLAAMDPGQQGGAAPAATVPFWTTGGIIFVVVVAIGGTLLGLGAAGELGGGSKPVTPTTP